MRAAHPTASPPAVASQLEATPSIAEPTRTAGARPIALLVHFLGAAGGPARWP